jgi:hypothetical protein
MSSLNVRETRARGFNSLMQVCHESCPHTSQSKCHRWHLDCCCAVGEKGLTTIERTWALTLAVVMLFAALTVLTKESATQPHVAIASPASHTTTVIDSRARTFPAREDDWAEPRLDLNGNDIDPAVSDYRVDGRGEMYERHAPDTELLHLSAPEL